MKRGVVAFVIAMTAAGVASALGPLPSLPSRPSQTETQPAQTQPTPAADVSPAVATLPKPSIEARQAPVPLIFKPHRTIEPPPYDADAVGPVPPKAADSAGEGEGWAKAAIETDGYKGVKVLRKGDGGVWYAEALRGKDRVLLTVDAQGNVAQQ